jgi:hypothetical protein
MNYYHKPVLQHLSDSEPWSVYFSTCESIGQADNGLNNEDHGWYGGYVTNLGSVPATEGDVLWEQE